MTISLKELGDAIDHDKANPPQPTFFCRLCRLPAPKEGHSDCLIGEEIERRPIISPRIHRGR